VGDDFGNWVLWWCVGGVCCGEWSCGVGLVLESFWTEECGVVTVL
jgi:hypothetical protein